MVSPHPCTPTFGALCSRRDLGHLPPHSQQGAALHPGFAAGAQAVSRGQARVGSADRQPVGRALPVWGWDTPAASCSRFDVESLRLRTMQTGEG